MKPLPTIPSKPCATFLILDGNISILPIVQALNSGVTRDSSFIHSSKLLRKPIDSFYRISLESDYFAASPLPALWSASPLSQVVYCNTLLISLYDSTLIFLFSASRMMFWSMLYHVTLLPKTLKCLSNSMWSDYWSLPWYFLLFLLLSLCFLTVP